MKCIQCNSLSKKIILSQFNFLLMKLKTHSGAKKRIRFTGTGKAFTDKSGKRHLLSQKSKKAKGRDKYGHEIVPADMKKVRLCLPYGK